MAKTVEPSPVQNNSANRGFDPSDPLSPKFLSAVASAIEVFLQGQIKVFETKLNSPVPLWHLLEPLFEEAMAITGGGKRLRPAFCYWGYTAIAGQPDSTTELVKAASSLDLLHASLLVHDDIIDAADTRRGRPSSHRVFEMLHADSNWRGSAETFGRSAAIILGDLLGAAHEEMFRSSGLDATAIAQAAPIATAMRAEVQAGQYLDILMEQLDSHARGEIALRTSAQVVEYKSGRYSVMRPTQIGAALGGASATQLSGLADFGSPLGLAFQYRDDLLGVFGDEETTGKPAGDDLREGKRTVLVAHALALAPKTAADTLDVMLGDPDLTAEQIDAGREIIANSGAKEKVEDEIDAQYAKAMEALSKMNLTADGMEGLSGLAKAATQRNF